ncbi:MAG: hypothetical protein KatS3mg037_1209 [Ignavibacterium sp.]|nr:MAG: hypothetical protein KatS3mg037_1209 [Ignavibacterium sp.]
MKSFSPDGKLTIMITNFTLTILGFSLILIIVMLILI